MKNLIFILFAVVAWGFQSNAQSSKTNLEKAYGSLVSIDVPSTVLAKTPSGSSEVILPLYRRDGKVILTVLNETGVSAIYTSPGVIPPADYKQMLASKLTSTEAEDLAERKVRCGILCWIKIVIDAVCGVFDCSIQQ